MQFGEILMFSQTMPKILNSAKYYTVHTESLLGKVVISNLNFVEDLIGGQWVYMFNQNVLT